MERVAFTMRLLPGAEGEYRRRHADVWPEMLDELRAGGCGNYSIYLLDEQLIGVFDVEDFDRFRAHMAASPVNDALAGRHGPPDRSLHGSRDGLPPPARGGLPP